MQRAGTIRLAIGVLVIAGIASWLFLRDMEVPRLEPATAAAQNKTSHHNSTEGGDPVHPTPLLRGDSRKSADDAAYRTWRKNIAETLAARGDADSLAAAASIFFLLRKSDDDPDLSGVIALLERAASLAPLDATIQSVALQTCRLIAQCDSARHETALREIDPNNALGWVLMADRAARDGNAAAMNATAAEIAKTNGLHVYWTDHILRVVHAAESVRVAPPMTLASPSMETLRDTLFKEMLSFTVQLPWPKAIVEACRSAVIAADRCRQVGAALEHSDTILAQRVGLGIGKDLARPDSPEARRISEMEHRIDWLLRSSGPALYANTDRWLRLFETHRNEAEIMRESLLESGLLTEPPKTPLRSISARP